MNREHEAYLVVSWPATMNVEISKNPAIELRQGDMKQTRRHTSKQLFIRHPVLEIETFRHVRLHYRGDGSNLTNGTPADFDLDTHLIDSRDPFL